MSNLVNTDKRSRINIISQAEPVVVYIRETNVAPDIDAVEHFRVGLVLAVPVNLYKYVNKGKRRQYISPPPKTPDNC